MRRTYPAPPRVTPRNAHSRAKSAGGATLTPMPETPDDVAARLRAATALLEAIARDRSLLGTLSVEERTRLLSAAGDVFEPDLVQRRLWGKAIRRNEKLAKRERDAAVLAETG